MTKFEQIGVNYQMDATNYHEANRSFTNSCNCCVTKGIKLNCDHCAIKQAHQQTIFLITEYRKFCNQQKKHLKEIEKGAT